MQLGSPIKEDNLFTLIDSIYQGEPDVYETYSVPDEELRTFSSAGDVMAYIEEVREQKDKLVYLSIHYPLSNGYIRHRKIELNPEKCKGAMLRYSTEGWGLIQFQLWLDKKDLFCSIGANSETRALTWAVNNPEMKSPDLWNWKEVAKQKRRLNRSLIKCA